MSVVFSSTQAVGAYKEIESGGGYIPIGTGKSITEIAKKTASGAYTVYKYTAKPKLEFTKKAFSVEALGDGTHDGKGNVSK